jgi:hypothetical protein
VIILSTVTGAANFAVGSIVPADNHAAQQYVAACLGAVSIFAGILTTLGNFFQYAQKSEAHRVCSIAWGKFQRLVQVELAINPMDRIDAMDFLKICRQDLDRLIEQSPGIPDDIIKIFEDEFEDIDGLKRPDICHGLEHTRVFDASNARLAKVAAEALLHLRYKKNMLSEAVLPELDKRIENELNTRLEQRIKELVNPPSPPNEHADASSVVSSLETDWRKLLVKKKLLTQINTEPPIQVEIPAEIPVETHDETQDDTRIEEVRVNVIGEDESPSTDSSEGGSVATNGEVTPVVRFV